MNSDWHYQIKRTKKRRENMGRFEKFIEEIHSASADTIDEKAVLALKKAVPEAAPILKKLANGVYGQKIKGMSPDEKVELSKALEIMLKILERN
tara:strand:- start:2501 stop:2782 length:282 start_codon:yes stop_codon:yes gene_type:complete